MGFKVSRSLMFFLAWRLLCVILFICNVTWDCLLYSLLFLASFFIKPHLLFGSKTKGASKERPVKTKNIVKSLYPEISKDDEMALMINGVMKLVSYDVLNNACMNNFELVKKHSNCVFARQAKLWGSPDWDESIGLAGNMIRMLPMFLKFTIICARKKLDGFLLELPGHIYGNGVECFGDALCQVLKHLSDKDPAGVHCMDKHYVGKRGWVFEFNNMTFFITTFAPFYPKSHPRYAFGAKNCYILFQPELSFAFHDLPQDTPHTNWDEPETVRDRIRVAFKEAGRLYSIPESVSSPMVLEMLRPINDGDLVYQWWTKHQVQKLSLTY